jgi:predicted transcriptional regulator of viral defense system
MENLKKTKFPIARAVALELEKLGFPVVLRYDIARITWRLYKAQSYEGQLLSIKKDVMDASAFASVEKTLKDNGVLKPLQGVPQRSAYALIGGGTVDRNALMCSIDLFCYLSHLSAMEFHGFTDRLPEQIYVSTPAGKDWTAFAEERMRKDLGEDRLAYGHSGLPLLRRVAITKIGSRPIHRYASVHPGAFRVIKGSPVRVATIGRTFLDMLREPHLCGGLAHVIEVFKEHAASNKRLIFDELDQHGAPIDKVRAGYILEDLCQITDPRINEWVAFAARGGSRKLDPSADYEPRFSDRWMLSINIPMARDEDD